MRDKSKEADLIARARNLRVDDSKGLDKFVTDVKQYVIESKEYSFAFLIDSTFGIDVN